MKKIIALLLSVLMVVGAVCILPGCGQQEEKGKVYYLNPNPEAAETWQTIASCYTEETGIEVRVDTTAAGAYEEVLAEKLASDDAPTLFQCDDAQSLAQWGEYCLDLTDTTVRKEMITSEFNLTDENGGVKAIGYCYEAFGIIVNKDLLQQAGYEITDISDFASLKAVAEDIHSRSEELGFDAFVTPHMSSSSWIRSGLLSNAPDYYRLANLPLYYEFRGQEDVQLPTSINGTYLWAYKNIWDLTVNNAAAMTLEPEKETEDTGIDTFGSGKAVFWQQGTWMYSQLVSQPYQMDPGALQMIPIYCGLEGEENAALCCGTQNRWAVNAKAGEADIQATLDFLTWVVTSGYGTDAMAEQFGAMPFKSAKTANNVFYADSNRLIADGKYIVTWSFHQVPDADQWRLGVASALTDYSAGHAEWTSVETAFIEGWAKQYEK